MNATIYFPPFHGEAECHKCELEDCSSRGRYQRNKRDFTYEDGRCPKLPDQRGFAHSSQRDNQRAAYPLIYAECGYDKVFLHISIPGSKKTLTVYETKSGYLYFNTKNEYGKIRRLIFIDGNRNHESIYEFMDTRNFDYCIFSCEITDFTV
jgi:hypothetical protein